jgi:sulfite exporter TauE/SafE
MIAVVAQFASGGERMRVNPIRGIVMLVAAALAIWKGWQIHHGETAVLAYGLGALALALGVWHLTRKTPQPKL